jgi:hypothetical protein
MTRTGGYSDMRGKILDPQLNPQNAMSCDAGHRRPSFVKRRESDEI